LPFDVQPDTSRMGVCFGYFVVGTRADNVRIGQEPTNQAVGLDERCFVRCARNLCQDLPAIFHDMVYQGEFIDSHNQVNGEVRQSRIDKSVSHHDSHIHTTFGLRRARGYVRHDAVKIKIVGYGLAFVTYGHQLGVAADRFGQRTDREGLFSGLLDSSYGRVGHGSLLSTQQG
jgi:hypothetical protein